LSACSAAKRGSVASALAAQAEPFQLIVIATASPTPATALTLALRAMFSPTGPGHQNDASRPAVKAGANY
jgi:hypothetical protein